MDHDITPQLRSWLLGTIDPIPDPVHLYPAVAADAHAAPRRRGWLPRLRPTGTGVHMLSASKFIVAAVVVASFGGFLLAAASMQQPSDESLPVVGATATPDVATPLAVELPAEIPEGVDSGTLDTPLGPARWVHLSGDDQTLPGDMSPIPVPGGYVTFDERPHPYESCTESEQCQYLWFSPDLLAWARRQLPVAAEWARLDFSGGDLWLTANDRSANEEGRFDLPTLWRSDDALEWEAVELDGLESPFPATIDWRAYIDEIAASGDETVAQVTFEALVGRKLLGLPLPPEGEDRVGDYAELQPDNADSYRVLGGYGEELGWVTFEVTADGVRVLDAATDAVLADIPGIGMGFIKSWAASDGRPTVIQLVRLEGGRVEATKLPSAEPGVGLRAPRSLFASDDGFRWFSPSADGLTHLWASVDGRDWELEDTYGDDPGEPAQVTQGREGLESRAWSEPRQVADLITSTDGREWQVHRAPSADIVLRFGEGWILPGPGGLTFYADGPDEPTSLGSVQLPLKTDSAGAGGYGMGAMSPNTIVHTVIEDEDFAGRQRDHWIITFDDLPASGRS